MPQIYVKDYDTTVSFDSGVPMSEIQKALKRQFPPKRTFKDKALSFVTMGHVGGEYGPEEEVTFTPEGKMEGMEYTKGKDGKMVPMAQVPSGDPGFFQDPVTALAMGGFAGVRAAAGPVGKMVTAGREALGWVTGGVSDVPQLAKAGTEALAKAANGDTGRLVLYLQTVRESLKGAKYSIIPGTDLFKAVSGIQEIITRINPQATGTNDPQPAVTPEGGQ